MKPLRAALIFAAGLNIFISQAHSGETVIHGGSKVGLDYVLTVEGKVVDSSQAKGPLEYTQGDGKLIPGLSRQLEGLKVGDEKTIEVKPEEAYGTPDPKAFRDVPLSNLPAGMTPTVGTLLQSKDDTGQIYISRIAEVKKDSVLMNFNHPLAGKTLSFKVKIVSVK